MWKALNMLLVEISIIVVGKETGSFKRLLSVENIKNTPEMLKAQRYNFRLRRGLFRITLYKLHPQTSTSSFNDVYKTKFGSHT